MKALPIQSAAELQFSSYEVEVAFAIHYNFDTLVFKGLVAFLHLVVKGHFVHQAGTSTSLDANAHKTPLRMAISIQQFEHFIAGAFIDCNHRYSIDFAANIRYLKTF